MAKAVGRKVQNKSPHSRKQLEVLKALEAAAKRQGLKVSAGQLRFAGLRLKGGSCLLRGRQWLILDKNQPFDDLVDIYRQALTLSEVKGSGLAPEMVELLAPYLSDSASGGGQAA